MAKEKKKIIPEKKHFAYVGGIALCLLSIILIVDIGWFARAIAFPFLFLFGIVAYVFYILFYIEGIYLLFKEKSLKIDHKIRIVGFFVSLVSLLILVSLIVCSTKGVNLALHSDETAGTQGFWDYFKGTLDSIKNDKTEQTGFFAPTYLDVFNRYPFGGGILGYFLTGLLNQFVGKVGSYILSILALIIGLGLFFLPTIIKVVKKQMQNQGMEVKEKPKAEKKKSFFSSLFNKEEKTNDTVRNVDVVSSASSLNDGVSTPRSDVQVTPIRDNSVFLDSQPFYQNSGNGQFTLARFHTSLDMDESVSRPVNNPQPAPAPQNVIAPRFMQNSFMEEEPAKEEVKEVTNTEVNPREKETQILLDATERQNKMEQMSIFEEENKQAYDPSLVYAQPVYQEPKVIRQGEAAQIRPPKERIKFIPPDISLLNDYEMVTNDDENQEVALARQAAINETFDNFKIGARCTGFIVGPSVTRYNIEYDSNVSVAAVKRYIEDLCVRLGGVGARFEQIVPGERFSGLEIPNASTSSVSFKEIMVNLPEADKHPLAIGFGKNISGKIIQADFNDFPHCLVAGTTGSGKSVFVHSVLMTLIMRNSPDDLKLILIDPKQVEMNMYDNLPHLLTPIINDAQRARNVLVKLCDEMDRRYSLFKEAKVLDMKNYNRWAKDNNRETLPYIIIIFDEYADCVDQCKEISQPVVRIAQKARAAGIHMLIATQRPSVNVVTGVIKGNLPTHIALMTSNAVDSSTILNEGGAEKLLGKGDMLVQSPLVSRIGCVRLQSPYVTQDEIRNVVTYLIDNYPVSYDPEYDDVKEEQIFTNPSPLSATVVKPTGNPEDDMYPAIKDWAMAQEYVSMSRIQREFGTGFNRAGRLFKRLQDEGIVASAPDTASSAKGCRVLVHDETTLVDAASSPEEQLLEDNNLSYE